MADGVELNSGTGGATAATDDCGVAGHAQIIKLAISTDGSATPIPAEATNGLDVDVTRCIPGTSATHLGKGEDVAHASGDTGVLMLAVRRDTAAVGSDTDGDASTVNVDGSGRVWVNGSGVTQPVSDAGASLTVDNAALSVVGGGVEATALRVTLASDSTGVISVDDNGTTLSVDDGGASLTIDGTVAVSSITTAVVPGTAATNLGKAEDDPHASGDVGVLLLAVRRDTAAVGSGTDGDNSTLNVNNAGRLYTSSTIDAALPAGDNNIGNVDIASAIPAGTNNIGDVDVLTVPADPFGANADAASATGSISAKLRFIASTGIPITGTVTVGSHAVTNAGTFAVQAACAGTAADDAAVSGNPVLNAGSSIQTDGTDPGAVSAEGEVATLRTDMQRNLLVNLTHPRFWHVSADYAAAQTNASVKAAPGAGLSLYVTDLILSNGATAGNITLLDGSGGTVLLEIYPAINGGLSKEFRNPIKLTANTALCITSTTVTTHSIFVSGYIAP